ncbi:MAG: MCE family protein [Solirubrobacterales bacterium]|nr:MCE family protein [Solirubrobacterales bacterium]
MNKQAPSIGQLITIAGFALSCFGLLLFVWVAFGGPTPLAASGYHLKMPMTQIGQLAEQSEVKISGVGVGHVTKIDLGENDQAADAIVTLELDPEYAPVPQDTRAILRAKSLLGEAYIELTPGDKRDGMLPDGGELPAAQVAKSVQLDEIFRTFDAKTREAFMQGAIDNAIATHGRGATLNQTLGILPGTLTEITDVLTVLNEQEEDLSKLIRNTGVVFDALSRRQGELSGMIRNTNTVFQTTAAREQDLQDFFRVFPTFLRESRATQTALGDFSHRNLPNVQKMIPVARQLSPTLKASADLAPVSKRLYRSLEPVIRKAPRAFPSFRAFLDDDAPRLLGRIPDYFAEYNPILETAGYYKKELAAFLGNAAAATNARATTESNGQVRYVRANVTIGPESIAAYPAPIGSTRSNPYVASGGGEPVGSTKVFNSAMCSGFTANYPAWGSLTPIQQAQFGNNLQYPYTAAQVQSVWDNVSPLMLRNQPSTDTVPAPGCSQQAPFTPIGDPSRPATRYQHVFRDPTP